MKLIPDIVGLMVIASFCIIGSWIVSDDQLRSWIWKYIFLAFAAVGLLFWRDSRMPTNSSDWLKMAVGTCLLGLVFFAVDVLLGNAVHPDMSIFTAATHAGGLFGFYFTVLICPCMTVLSLAGAIRASVKNRLNQNVQ